MDRIALLRADRTRKEKMVEEVEQRRAEREAERAERQKQKLAEAAKKAERDRILIQVCSTLRQSGHLKKD